jgi:hypothetical protein
MTLTVETGAGLADADALVSLADCDAYHTAQGHADWTGPDADKESAIRRATTHLSRAVTWTGVRTHGRAQALAWPRSGCVDGEGNGIASNEIPGEIADACAELALIELATPGALSPVVTPSDAVKSETIGPISVEYALPTASVNEHRAKSAAVMDLIRHFVCSGGLSSVVGRLYRA